MLSVGEKGGDDRGEVGDEENETTDEAVVKAHSRGPARRAWSWDGRRRQPKEGSWTAE